MFLNKSNKFAIMAPTCRLQNRRMGKSKLKSRPDVLRGLVIELDRQAIAQGLHGFFKIISDQLSEAVTEAQHRAPADVQRI